MHATRLSTPLGDPVARQVPLGRAHWQWAPPVLALLLSLAAVGAAALLAPYAPTPLRDPELVTLLGFMALVKGLMLATALGLVAWRTRWPLPVGTAAAYVLACGVAALAVALIARLAWVGPAALMFHAAELGFLCTAWRDGRRLRPTTAA